MKIARHRDRKSSQQDGADQGFSRDRDGDDESGYWYRYRGTIAQLVGGSRFRSEGLRADDKI